MWCGCKHAGVLNNKRGPSPSAVSKLRVLVVLSVALVGVFVAVAAGKQHRSGRPGSSQAAGDFGQVANCDAGERQWFWQNPLPQGNDLRAASFIDANTAILVGAYGTIIRTKDTGSRCAIQPSGTTETLWAGS